MDQIIPLKRTHDLCSPYKHIPGFTYIHFEIFNGMACHYNGHFIQICSRSAGHLVEARKEFMVGLFALVVLFLKQVGIGHCILYFAIMQTGWCLVNGN